jgi:hypothetical protein
MPPKSVVPLRIGAVVLAVLGICPLAVVIKYAPVVQWVPVAATEWLVAAWSALAVLALSLFPATSACGTTCSFLVSATGRGIDIVRAQEPVIRRPSLPPTSAGSNT